MARISEHRRPRRRQRESDNDIADGWQRADEYLYPQQAANLAIRLGVNFAVYALTH